MNQARMFMGSKNGLAAQLGIEPESNQGYQPLCRRGLRLQGRSDPTDRDHCDCSPQTGPAGETCAHPRDRRFTLIATFRAETRQRIQLSRPRMTASFRRSITKGSEVTSRADPYAVAGTDASTRMYACPNVASNVRIVRADRATPGFMQSASRNALFSCSRKRNETNLRLR